MSKKNKSLVCTSCGCVGVGKKVTSGSLGMELSLLLVGIIFLFLFWYVGIIIITATIGYSVYRTVSRKTVCKKCGNASLIPTDTPMAKKILSEINQNEIYDEKH